MFDYVTLSCPGGIMVFSFLWRKASSRVWYDDTDNDPVSLKAVCGLIWLVCLVTLICQQVRYFAG